MLKVIKPIINWVCYIATITSFVCLFVKDTIAIVIAIAVFVIILLGIAIYILRFIYSHLKRTNYEFIGHATFVKYETKPDNYRSPASLKRKKIKTQTGSADYNILKTISFDETCKSYEYHLLEPEVGYFYRIEWEK